MEKQINKSELCTPKDHYWLNITVARLLFHTNEPEYFFNRITEGMNETIKAALRKFLFAYLAKKYDNADFILKELLLKNKKNMAILFLGWHYFNFRQNERLRTKCAYRIYLVDKNCTVVWEDVAFKLGEKGKYEEAVNLLKRFLKEKEKSDLTAALVGFMYGLAEMDEEHLKFIESFKWNEVINKQKAYILYYTITGQTDDAETIYEAVKDKLNDIDKEVLKKSIDFVKLEKEEKDDDDDED